MTLLERLVVAVIVIVLGLLLLWGMIIFNTEKTPRLAVWEDSSWSKF
jgi:hypothetical protein